MHYSSGSTEHGSTEYGSTFVNQNMDNKRAHHMLDTATYSQHIIFSNVMQQMVFVPSTPTYDTVQSNIKSSHLSLSIATVLVR